MYLVASIKACVFRTTNCLDVPLNQSIELIWRTARQLGDIRRDPARLVFGDEQSPGAPYPLV
jgi:hypothetical protein